VQRKIRRRNKAAAKTGNSGDRSASETDLQTTSESETAKEEEKEIGGPKGPEPTRYGDWEQKGRCTDF
jgi:hypothetical protein